MLLLDEMYPSLIARELRARGHDMVSVHESPGGGTPDEQVFAFAQAEKRWPRSDPGAFIAALDRLLAATPDQPVDGEIWL